METTVKEIAVFGAGGFGLEVAMLIEQINAKKRCWRLRGFFDDGMPKGKKNADYEVLGGINDLNNWEKEIYIAVALGIPATKMAVINQLKNPNIKYPILIHPSAIIGDNRFNSIGEGSIICAGNIITTHVKIGKHVVINLTCTVGHETVIGDYSSLMPACNISGEVTIGKANFWGTGAKIINRCSVGDNVIIGAGAVVTENMPGNVTAVGIPARPVDDFEKVTCEKKFLKILAG